MTIKVGINGFGRIGRSVFRALAQSQDMQVVAINDIFGLETLAYLLKYDTVMGPFAKTVTLGKDALCVDGKKVAMTAHKDPADLPWAAHQCDIVVEATGIFATRAALQKHLHAGAKRVVLTVPPKDDIDNMVVLGVNDASLTAAHKLVSNASCTTNCLAPLAKVLDESFGIEGGLMSTVHAYTNDQRLCDAPHKDARRSRAAALNIIPTTTGAARAVGKIMPQLKGRLDGMASRVPVPNGSIVDLVVRLRTPADAQQINQAVHAQAQGPLRGILQYSEDALVSADIIGNPHSCIFDAALTQARGDGWARVVAWYDNEWGYSNRCVELMRRLAALSPP